MHPTVERTPNVLRESRADGSRRVHALPCLLERRNKSPRVPKVEKESEGPVSIPLIGSSRKQKEDKAEKAPLEIRLYLHTHFRRVSRNKEMKIKKDVEKKKNPAFVPSQAFSLPTLKRSLLKIRHLLVERWSNHQLIPDIPSLMVGCCESLCRFVFASSGRCRHYS